MQDKIFASLQISKEQFLTEIALLLVKQQLSEYMMEIDYFERKYGQTFLQFDKYFRTRKASYEMENDWMSWKFAMESQDYWQNILNSYGS